MFELAPDRPDFDEYEAEQERRHRHLKRLEHFHELAELRGEEEREREDC